MLVVNFFGGPGVGKSTTAAGVFAMLKLHDINCELVTEFAKELTWEGRHDALTNQLYVSGNQWQRMLRAENCDVIVTDSPILLGAFYDQLGEVELHTLLRNRFDSFENLNFVIDRVKPFQQAGRNQDRATSILLDNKIHQYLTDYQVRHFHILGDFSGINAAVLTVIELTLKQVKRFSLRRN
jgi:hypothetical protein